MKRTTEKLSSQMKKHNEKEIPKKKALEGNTETMISTGSTLLDLAICGTRKKGGGLPGGILVEIFGPSSAGKSVLLSEIAGSIQRGGGDLFFHDPEARLNKAFAKIFDFNLEDENYSTPDTVTEVFKQVRSWKPRKKAKIHGICADSLAALSTNLEMDNEDGDKMGMRRAKEFSEQTRKTCRTLAKKNYIMVCSNQIRENADAGYGEKTTTPGGKAIGFYASLRLQVKVIEKLKKKIKFHGKLVEQTIGVCSEIYVYKSSIDKPFRKAKVYIIFDYGIDDIRANLKFIKEYSRKSFYTFAGEKLDISLEASIDIIEKRGLEKELRKETIALWEEMQSKFESNRKHKQR